jgi:hypothetical protein
MRVTSGGNVGIGTTNPDFGSFGSSERILGISNPTSGTRARLSFQNLSTGTSGVSGTLAFWNGSTTLASLDVNADGATNKGVYVFNTNDGSSNSERMRISSSGFVGINTTSPTQRLDVRGLVSTTFTATGITVPNNNTGTKVLDPSVNGNFWSWMTSTFNCGNYVAFVTCHWDTGNSACHCMFVVNYGAGYQGVSTVRLSATTYRGDISTDGTSIYIYNQGGSNLVNPVFTVFPLGLG